MKEDEAAVPQEEPAELVQYLDTTRKSAKEIALTVTIHKVIVNGNQQCLNVSV